MRELIPSVFRYSLLGEYMFKVGDKVELIKNNSLYNHVKLGKIYKVTNTAKEGKEYYLKLKNQAGDYCGAQGIIFKGHAYLSKDFKLAYKDNQSEEVRTLNAIQSNFREGY